MLTISSQVGGVHASPSASVVKLAVWAGSPARLWSAAVSFTDFGLPADPGKRLSTPPRSTGTAAPPLSAQVVSSGAPTIATSPVSSGYAVLREFGLRRSGSSGSVGMCPACSSTPRPPVLSHVSFSPFKRPVASAGSRRQRIQSRQAFTGTGEGHYRQPADELGVRRRLCRRGRGVALGPGPGPPGRPALGVAPHGRGPAVAR